MPRAPIRYLCGLWAAALLLAPAALRAEMPRAQVPVNPLRPAAVTRMVPLDPWDDGGQPAVQPIAVQENLPPPEPRSIVPPQLGQSAIGNGSYFDPPGAGPAGDDSIGHDSLVQPWFTHTDPNDPYRHIGLGRPLIGTSWLNRPWFVGGFLGGLLADDLISGEIESNNSFFLGGRVGWDFDHYWGMEGRYAYSHPQLTGGDGVSLSDRSRDYFIDMSLAYYPWGDSQWRPFVTWGFGLQTFRFHDRDDRQISQSLLSMPIGIGLKFYHSPWHTLRLDLYDNIAFGDGRLSSMQNFTLAAGVEFRFGGRPTSYFPWHGGTAMW
jgi:hypothetical protein